MDNQHRYAVIVAGGSGSRMNSAIAKQFLILNGLPVLMHTITAFEQAKVNRIIVVLPKSQQNFWQQLCLQYNFTLDHTVVTGGSSRFQSVRNGLGLVPENTVVAVHDGVRPIISTDLIDRSYNSAAKQGNAVAAVALKDSIRRKTNQFESISERRDQFWLVQTPQTFKSTILKKAYEQAERSEFTDCASVAEAEQAIIHLIEGDYRNIKITTPEDLLVASLFLEKSVK